MAPEFSCDNVTKIIDMNICLVYKFAYFKTVYAFSVLFFGVFFFFFFFFFFNSSKMVGTRPYCFVREGKGAVMP